MTVAIATVILARSQKLSSQLVWSAMSLSQSWQDVAFEAGDYVARPAYAAVLTVLVQATNRFGI